MVGSRPGTERLRRGDAFAFAWSHRDCRALCGGHVSFAGRLNDERVWLKGRAGSRMWSGPCALWRALDQRYGDAQKEQVFVDARFAPFWGILPLAVLPALLGRSVVIAYNTPGSASKTRAAPVWSARREV
jgi:hypothetical protein